MKKKKGAKRTRENKSGRDSSERFLFVGSRMREGTGELPPAQALYIDLDGGAPTSVFSYDLSSRFPPLLRSRQTQLSNSRGPACSGLGSCSLTDHLRCDRFAFSVGRAFFPSRPLTLRAPNLPWESGYMLCCCPCLERLRHVGLRGLRNCANG